MTARKPKPRKAAPRKASKPTLEQRMADMEKRVADMKAVQEYDGDWLEQVNTRLNSMEARAHFRDASHDEPVSNAGEIPPRETQPSCWRRFLAFMRTP
jgi:hypothetical protein